MAGAMPGPVVKIGGDANQLNAELAKAETRLAGFGRTAAAVAKGPAGGAAALALNAEKATAALRGVASLDFSSTTSALQGAGLALAGLAGPIGLIAVGFVAVIKLAEQFRNSGIAAREAWNVPILESLTRTNSVLGGANAAIGAARQIVEPRGGSGEAQALARQDDMLEMRWREVQAARLLNRQMEDAGQITAEQARAARRGFSMEEGSLRITQLRVREMQNELGVAEALNELARERDEHDRQLQQVRARNMNSLERAQAAMQQANELFFQGAGGDLDQYVREVARVENELIAAAEAAGRFQNPTAAGAGSREALESIQKIRLQSEQSGGGHAERLQNAVERLRAVNEQQARDLAEIRRAVVEQGAPRVISLS